jgi:hypothetical protein
VVTKLVSGPVTADDYILGHFIRSLDGTEFAS